MSHKETQTRFRVHAKLQYTILPISGPVKVTRFFLAISTFLQMLRDLEKYKTQRRKKM